MVQPCAVNLGMMMERIMNQVCVIVCSSVLVNVAHVLLLYCSAFIFKMMTRSSRLRVKVRVCVIWQLVFLKHSCLDLLSGS